MPHIQPLTDHTEVAPEEPSHVGFIPLQTHVELVEELNGWRMRFVYALTLCVLMAAIIVFQAVWILRLLFP